MSQPEPRTPLDATDDDRCHVRRFEIRAEVENLLTLDLRRAQGDRRPLPGRLPPR